MQMGKLDNYSCNGQMDIFDFIKKDEPEIILQPGEHIYKVLKGDIIEYEVEDWTYTCGEDDRGYGLIYIDLEDPDSDFHTYSRVWNSSFEGEGQYFFRDKKAAEHKVRENLKNIEHILAKDMKPVKVVAWELMSNGHKHVEWYAVLDNGLIYFDYGSIYKHIGTEKEIKKFMKVIADNKNRAKHSEFELFDYKPQFKNMFKCNDHDWVYAESRFGEWE